MTEKRRLFLYSYLCEVAKGRDNTPFDMRNYALVIKLREDRKIEIRRINVWTRVWIHQSNVLNQSLVEVFTLFFLLVYPFAFYSTDFGLPEPTVDVTRVKTEERMLPGGIFIVEVTRSHTADGDFVFRLVDLSFSSLKARIAIPSLCRFRLKNSRANFSKT